MSRKKVSRNDPCPCGSGKKYKHCCYRNRVEDNLQQSQFPIGTVAKYGPDDTTTTKITAGVILRENAEPILMRWVATDVLTNLRIRQEIAEFFADYEVKRSVISDGNMGCPHEEGEDFPIGEDCPFCPFWKGKQGSGRKE